MVVEKAAGPESIGFVPRNVVNWQNESYFINDSLVGDNDVHILVV